MLMGGRSYLLSGSFYKFNDYVLFVGWMFLFFVKLVWRGDIVCIMKGVLKFIIVRFCLSFFFIIVSRVLCCGLENIRNFLYCFLLIWDWGCREE